MRKELALLVVLMACLCLTTGTVLAEENVMGTVPVEDCWEMPTRNLVADGYSNIQDGVVIIEVYAQYPDSDSSYIDRVNLNIVNFFTGELVIDSDYAVQDNRIVLPMNDLGIDPYQKAMITVTISEVENSNYVETDLSDNVVEIYIPVPEPDFPYFSIEQSIDKRTGMWFIDLDSDLGALTMPTRVEFFVNDNSISMDTIGSSIDGNHYEFFIGGEDNLITGDNRLIVRISPEIFPINCYSQESLLVLTLPSSDFALNAFSDGTVITGTVTGDASVLGNCVPVDNFQLGIFINDKIVRWESIGRDFAFDLSDDLPKGQSCVTLLLTTGWVEEIDYTNNEVSLVMEKGSPKDLRFYSTHLDYVFSDYVIGYVEDMSGEDSPFYWFNCSMWLLDPASGEIIPLISQEIATECSDKYWFRASLRDLGIGPGNYKLCGQVDFMSISSLYDPDMSNNQDSMDIIVCRNLGIGYFEYNTTTESILIYIDGDGGVAKEVTLSARIGEEIFYKEYFESLEASCIVEIPITGIETGFHEVTVEIYTPYDDEEDNNAPTSMTREIEIVASVPVEDLVAVTGIHSYPNDLYLDSYIKVVGGAGIMNPEGVHYLVHINGQEVYNDVNNEDWFTIDMRSLLVVGENHFSSEVSKEGVYDPDLTNNFIKRSIYLQANSYAQDFAIDCSYDEATDTLTVKAIPVPGDTYVPEVYHVDIYTESGELFSFNRDISQECVFEDFSNYLVPGDNEVTVKVSYTDQAVFYDSDMSNNQYAFSVLIPATDIAINDLVVNKVGAKDTEVYFEITGIDSYFATEVFVEIYDKNGELRHSKILYDTELFSVYYVLIPDSWSDFKDMTVKVYVPGEQNMEDNVLNR